MKRTNLFWIAIFTLFLSIIFLTSPVQAGNCTWFGGDGLWSSPANWSGCAGSAPGLNDTAVISSGTVTFDQTTTIAGLDMSGGELLGSGQTLTVTTGILFTGGGNKRIAGMTLNNGGTAVWDDGTLTFGPWPNPTNFHNQAGAAFEIAGARNTLHSAGSAILNDGAIVKTGPGLSDIAANLGVRNDGLIRVEEGQLRMNGTRGIPVEVFTHSGAFEALAGAAIQFDGTQEFGPTASVTGAGDAAFIRSGGWFVLDPDTIYNMGGRTTIACFNCAVRFHNTATTGELYLDQWSSGAPQIEGEGVLIVTGQTIWRQGVIGHTGNYINNGPITVEMQGGLDLQTGTSHIVRDAIIRNHGEAVYSGGSFYIRYFNASFVNLPGATFTFPGPRDVGYYWGGQDLPLARFVNQGTLIKSGAGYATFSGVILENSGAIEAQAGGLAFRRSPDGSNNTGGRLVMLSGGAATFADLPLRVEENSWLLGRGAINGPVWVEGHISPGHPGFGGTLWEVAQLTINGDLELRVNGRYLTKLLSPGLPGVGHDRIAVHGNALINGRLQISLADAYDPPMGAEFSLLTCSQGCLGFFNDLIVTPEDMSFQLLYQDDQVVAHRLGEEGFSLYLPLVTRP